MSGCNFTKNFRRCRMEVFVVTDKELKEKKVGEHKIFKCYLMGFFRYRKIEERGFVFTTAKQALNFMLKAPNMYIGKK